MMIHNIPLGYKTKTRISKEEYGERLQAVENGETVESEEETDEEVEVIEERGTLEENRTNARKQDTQTTESEVFLGGDSFIHKQQEEEHEEDKRADQIRGHEVILREDSLFTTQRGEEKDEDATHNGTKINNDSGNQHSVVLILDENLDCSEHTGNIEHGYIRHCIGHNV